MAERSIGNSQYITSKNPSSENASEVTTPKILKKQNKKSPLNISHKEITKLTKKCDSD